MYMDMFLDVTICGSYVHVVAEVCFLAVKNEFKDHLYKILHT